MKNILRFLSFDNFKNNILKILLRFPITVIIIFIITITLIILNHGNFTNIIENNIGRGVFSLIITLFLSIGVYISLENSKSSGIKKILIQIFPIVFGILFFLGFKNEIDDYRNIIFFILTLLGILSFIFFAPYTGNIIKNLVNKNVYYNYFYKISVVFLISIILGILLFALGSIAISSIFTLFDLSWTNHHKLILDWSIIALSLISPLFALTQIPNKETFLKDNFQENIFFSFLIKYITIPFIYLYFLILYIYTIKVLLNFGDWPKGEISWLVIGFSIFAYIAYIFSYIFEEKNKFISNFRKALPFVVIPQIFMLGYAIFLRIAQYDLTINRYFVVVFGLWLFAISIYYIFSRKKSLIIIPSILTLFIIIISIGPWSVYKLPETRQYNRLITNLELAGICINSNSYGKTCTDITPLKNYIDIDKELSRNIYSGIKFLCDFDNCSKIKNLFPKQYKLLEDKNKKNYEKLKKENEEKFKNTVSYSDLNYNEPSKWEIINYISEKIKVKDYYGIYDEKTIETIDINLKNTESHFPINISGYNKIYILNSYKNLDENYAQILIENKKILVIENSVTVEEIDISDILNELIQKYNSTNNNIFDKQDLVFEKGNYKIIFENISIENPNYGGDKINKYYYTNGYLLIK